VVLPGRFVVVPPVGVEVSPEFKRSPSAARETVILCVESRVKTEGLVIAVIFPMMMS
jgi:hypothetical protein